MARNKTFSTKIAIAQALRDFDGLSRFLQRQLVDLGYAETKKNAEAKKPGRGRMPVDCFPNAKGKALINLSKNWKPRAA